MQCEHGEAGDVVFCPDCGLRMGESPVSDAAARFAERQRIARLATADRSARPHVVPVCFALERGVLYTPVDRKPKTTARLKRVRNILENSQATALFDHYEEDWSALGWVMMTGRASVLEGGLEHERAAPLLRDRYPQYREMALDDRPVIRLRVDRCVAWGTASDD